MLANQNIDLLKQKAVVLKVIHTNMFKHLHILFTHREKRNPIDTKKLKWYLKSSSEEQNQPKEKFHPNPKLL